MVSSHDLLPHGGLIMCLQLVGTAITLHEECGVVLVLLGRTYFLYTDQLGQINEPACRPVSKPSQYSLVIYSQF